MDQKSLLLGTALNPPAFGLETVGAMKPYIAAATVNGVAFEHRFYGPASAALVKFPMDEILKAAGVGPEAVVTRQTLRPAPATVPFLMEKPQ